MSNQQAEMKQIKRLIAIWISEIRLNNYENYTDINKVSEHLSRQLLNKIYDFQLEDLNRIKANFPGLDIGDTVKELIAYQVTSRVDNAKIIDALETVVKEQHQKVFKNGIRFLILNDKETVNFGKRAKKTPEKILETFKMEADILYPQDIIRLIEDIYEKDADLFKFNQIKNLLEKELIPISSGKPVSDPESENKKLKELLVQAIEKLGNREDAEVKVSSTFFFGDLQVPPITIISLRQNLVDKIAQDFAVYDLIWIQGPPSTGKTSLAILISRKINVFTLWIECRDIKSEQLMEHILTLLTQNLNIKLDKYYNDTLVKISNLLKPGSLLIFNDIPDLRNDLLLQQQLSELTVHISKKNISIIITSNYSNTQHFEIQQGYNFKPLVIPPIDVNDSIVIFEHFGANKEKASLFADLVTKSTQGHPLLIQSAAKFFKGKNWTLDEEAINSIFAGKYGDELEKESYIKVLSHTSDDQERELLYRLREVVGNFDLKILARLAAIKPAISHPAEKLNHVKDIWIQDIGNNHFQLSPIIKSLDGNIKPEIEKEINNELAISLIEKGNISQLEAFDAIYYFLKSEKFNRAAMVLFRVLTEFIQRPNLFFDWNFNVFWWNTKLPGEIAPFLKLQIRILQSTIAGDTNENYDFFINDIREIVSKEDIGVLGQASSDLFFYQKEINNHPINAFKFLLQAQKGFAELEVLEIADNLMNEQVLNGIWLIFSRLHKKEEFEEWFELYKSLTVPVSVTDDEKNNLYIMAGVSIFRNAVLQSKLTNENIPALLRFIANSAIDADLQLMAAYAIKYLVKFEYDNNSDIEAAQNVSKEFEKVLDKSYIYKFLVVAEIGRIHFLAGNYQAATYYFSELEDSYPSAEMYTEVLDFLISYMQVTAKNNSSLSVRLVEKALASSLLGQQYRLEDKVKLYGEVAITKVANKEYAIGLDFYEKGFMLLLEHFTDTSEQQAIIIRYGNALKYLIESLDDDVAKSYGPGGNVIPETGYFYRTNEKLLEGGFYFDERKFMVANAMQVCFETLGDVVRAKKWAYQSYGLSLDLKNAKFVPILQLNTFYLIQDREFRKAYNVQSYIDKYYTQLKENQLNNLLDVEQDKIVQALKLNDLSIYFFVLLPITLSFSLDIIKDNVRPDQYPIMINDAFITDLYVIKDTESFAFAKLLFERIMIEQITYEQMQVLFNSYKGEFRDILYIMGCILLSSFSSAVQSAHLQMAIIVTLDTVAKQMKSMYRHFVVPYFETFWKEKVQNNPKEFSTVAHLREFGFSLISKTIVEKRIGKIFMVLSNHLNLSIPPSVEKFIDLSEI